MTLYQISAVLSPPGRHPASRPHGDPRGGEMRLRLGDAVGAEMEDRGGEHGGGMAVADAGHEMVERADAARGDDGDGDGVGDDAGGPACQGPFGALPTHAGYLHPAAA